MAKTFGMKITGIDKAMKNLAVLGPAAAQGGAIMLKNFADTRIVTPAKEEYAPVVSGNLRSTIRSHAPVVHRSRFSVLVSAGGPSAKYALKVHENPRSGRTGGISPSGKKYYPRPGYPVPYSQVGQWKYLETPARIAAANSSRWLLAEAAAIMESIKRRVRI